MIARTGGEERPHSIEAVSTTLRVAASGRLGGREALDANPSVHTVRNPGLHLRPYSTRETDQRNDVKHLKRGAHNLTIATSEGFISDH